MQDSGAIDRRVSNTPGSPSAQVAPNPEVDPLAAGGLSDPLRTHALQARAATAVQGGVAPIQRYVDDRTLAPGKVSNGGEMVLAGRQLAYATPRRFAEANTALEAAGAARIKLVPGADYTRPDEQAWRAQFGPQTGPLQALKQVMPVFKQGKATAAQAAVNPVEGDNDPARQTKLAQYKTSLEARSEAIKAAKFDFRFRWNAEENRRKGITGIVHRGNSVSFVVWNDLNGAVTQVVKDTVGPMWLYSADYLAVGGSIPMDRRDVLTLDDYLRFFDQLHAAFAHRLATDLQPELTQQELQLTLPNDCKQAASQLTGLDGVALNSGGADPAVGQAYSISDLDSSAGEGWATHYATVIMKDRGDNLSFETAAHVLAAPEGKSLAFFEMYGTQNAAQSFDTITNAKNRAYAREKAALQS